MASGSILDGNSSGRFFRDYLEGRHEEDGLGILYKVEDIGDDKFPYRYFTGPKRADATKGKYYQGVPMAQLEDSSKVTYTPIENFYDLAGSFGNCRGEGGVDFRSGKKPEALMRIILKHFSRPGDLVLDSFAGSGTAGAVAHKMGRKWIMVELGEQCHTHNSSKVNKCHKPERPCRDYKSFRMERRRRLSLLSTGAIHVSNACRKPSARAISSISLICLIWPC